MTKISAVIITLNEAENIKRCIASLGNVADEIIVVDSHSSDNTKEIATQLGARVIVTNWKGYSATKNYGNSLAIHNYILSLDADEVLSEQLIVSIQKAKKSGLKGAYQFNRFTCYVDQWIRHCGWYPDKKIRLFPKSKASWQGDFVHESLMLDPGQKITFLRGDLLHYSFKSIEDHERKTIKYASLAAEKLKNRSKSGLMLKSLFSPAVRFIRMYVFQQGFRDGYYGFVICKLASKEVKLKYRMALKLKNNRS